MESYGSFMDGTVWASDVCLRNCLGNCSIVQYGGQFQTTGGFGQATCSGSLQNQTQVGFWCDWDGSGGALLTIDGDCQQADHGIAITEAEKASFLEKRQRGHDFGNDGDTGATNNNTYCLNPWMNQLCKFKRLVLLTLSVD